VANHDITAGSEITFSYGSTLESPARELTLHMKWGFTCTCDACSTPSLAAKVNRVLQLDKQIMEFGGRLQTERGLRAGAALIKLYDELQASPLMYSRTYYEMYQVSYHTYSGIELTRAPNQHLFIYSLIYHSFRLAST
jgi:hypothetical protein